MSEAVQLALITAVINAAVTWGVISTKLAWLRRDIDLAHKRIDNLEKENRDNDFEARINRQEHRRA
jgi:hypothetical protein